MMEDTPLLSVILQVVGKACTRVPYRSTTQAVLTPILLVSSPLFIEIGNEAFRTQYLHQYVVQIYSVLFMRPQTFTWSEII
jgi:hypothetical protein